MSKVIMKGKTVEEAIQKALIELNISREDAAITVIAEERSGLFGLFGKRQAEVEVESKEIRIKLTAKLLTPTLKGASHEGENEREGRRFRWWRWQSLVTTPLSDECFDESRPHRDSSRFGGDFLSDIPNFSPITSLKQVLRF